MFEEWRKVEGYDHNYEVSSHGRFKKNGKLVTPHENNGYLRVALVQNGRGKSVAVHRLVLLAFVGPCPEGMIGLHNDDVRENNRIDNLRWGTYQDNVQDAIGNGRFRRLGDQEVKDIRESKLSDRDAAKKYNMSEMAIFNIRAKVTYRNVI